MKQCRQCLRLTDDFRPKRAVCRECQNENQRFRNSLSPDHRSDDARCTECGTMKPATAFRASRMVCKSCESARQVERNRAAGWQAKRSPEAETRRRERGYARLRAWAQANPERVREHVARRRARQDSVANENWMRMIYAIAKDLGLEVDHVEPIVGKHASGLHTPLNVRLTAKHINRAKSNKRDT